MGHRTLYSEYLCEIYSLNPKPPVIEYETFCPSFVSGYHYHLRVFVPEGSISKYKKARYWERFESFHAIVVPHDDGVTDGGDDLKWTMTLFEDYTGGAPSCALLLCKGACMVFRMMRHLWCLCVFLGGGYIRWKMGVNWVFNGLNRCFGLSIGPFWPKQTQGRPKRTQSRPKLFGLIRPSKTRWLVDLLTCWLCWGRGKKKGPYSHEPGTFEFYE